MAARREVVQLVLQILEVCMGQGNLGHSHTDGEARKESCPKSGFVLQN